MPAPVVAVIEDDQKILDMLDVLLRNAGFRVISYTLGKDGHQFILRTMPDVVILDLWLEDSSAGSMVLGLLERDPVTCDIPILICSAHIAVLRDWAASLRDKGYDLLENLLNRKSLLPRFGTFWNSKRASNGAPPKNGSAWWSADVTLTTGARIRSQGGRECCKQCFNLERLLQNARAFLH